MRDMSASTPTTSRKCSATTKAGKPCSVSAMEGRETCLSHADEATRLAAGFGAEAAGRLGGRPPKPRPMEILRAKVEAEFDIWIKPFEDARVAVREDGSPDHAGRMKASESVLDRVYGKPTARTELSGPDEEAIPIWLRIVEDVIDNRLPIRSRSTLNRR